jgi:hypothetical protein
LRRFFRSGGENEIVFSNEPAEHPKVMFGGLKTHLDKYWTANLQFSDISNAHRDWVLALSGHHGVRPPDYETSQGGLNHLALTLLKESRLQNLFNVGPKPQPPDIIFPSSTTTWRTNAPEASAAASRCSRLLSWQSDFKVK